LRQPPASIREASAQRLVRWRIRLLLVSLAQITIAQLIVLLFLPSDARLFSVRVLCIAAVYLGATPILAALMQYAIVGFHRLRAPYRRLRPYYPRTAIVVPAWNEGAVIGRTIDQLLAMEYPADRVRIVVVDDASTDETPAVVQARASEHPGRVVHLRREVGGQGKAHTLNHGVQHVLSDAWAEAVMVMDADVLFERDALRKMTRHLSDPRVGAVTAYIKEGTPNGNYLTRFIAYEYITAQATARRAQNMLGVLACLAGGAQLHARESLEEIGGRIDASSLAEDTVTTFRTQLAGKRVEFDGNAVVWAEEPSDVVGLWKQRLRWSRGNVQISLQYASMWGKQRRTFGKLARLPFMLLWYTVVLMPVLMLGASVGLVTLWAIDAHDAWSAFRVLWIWHAVAYVFGTGISLAVDPQTAKRSWREAILFPGIISLLIMIYTVYPPIYDLTVVRWLHGAGYTVTEQGRSLLALFTYSWLFLCVPIAYLTKVWSESTRFKWLVPVTLYLVGYGPLLCAVTAAAYFKELFNARSIWDKTVKSGRVTIGAASTH
jgi:cellulose synthase/poly-beta-1,6-N-acetylglucosamine synthase-like glycosyltransferase